MAVGGGASGAVGAFAGDAARQPHPRRRDSGILDLEELAFLFLGGCNKGFYKCQYLVVKYNLTYIDIRVFPSCCNRHQTCKRAVQIDDVAVLRNHQGTFERTVQNQVADLEVVVLCLDYALNLLVREFLYL